MYKISLAYNNEENKVLAGQELASFIEDFKATAEDVEIRKSFASSLSLPILKTIAPQSSVRDIFYVDELPAGSLAEYPVDLNDIETAVVMPRLGAVPQNLVVGDSVIVPTFEVSNSVEWKLTFVRDGRFNIVERALEKLAESFIRAEELSGWATIRGAIYAGNTIASAQTTLTKTVFNDMITEMRAVYGYEPSDVYVSPRCAKEIRNWADTQIDPVTRREIFQAGGLNQIWNVRLHELRTGLGDKEIFLFDTSKFGVMPVRTNITSFDKPDAINRLRAGVIAYEEIGFGVLDKKAMLYITLT